MRSCATCGAALADEARYCPECGTRVEEPGGTLVDPLPPPENSAAPVAFGEQPRWFGITPPLAVLGLAAVALAFAILLLATGHTLLGVVLFVVAAALFALFVAELRRKPESPVARSSLDAIGGVRARVGAAVDAFGAVSTARRELLRLRREHDELSRRKERLLRSLGEAVYRADHQATETARADLSEVDEALSAKEAEMTTISNQMNERLSAARSEVSQTVLLEPAAEEVPPAELLEPAAERPVRDSGPGEGDGGNREVPPAELLEPPEPVPEPGPPPDEGTPPTPPPIPEPYPPPDEGTPPQPDPAPDETEPEEPAPEAPDHDSSPGEGARGNREVPPADTAS